MDRRRLSSLLAAGVWLIAAPLGAQGNSDNVRTLNGRVLQLQAGVRGGGAAQAAQARADAVPVFAQRAAALTALIRQDPRAALGLAFSQELRDALAADFPASAAALEQHGAWEGLSDHLIFDDPQRQVRRFTVQIQSGNDSAEVHSAAGEPDCVSGNTLRVEGVRIGGVIAAGNTSVQSTSVAAAGCQTTGAQSSAILLVQFPAIPLPANVTPAGVWDIFFASSGRSVNNYWQEASYGRASATGGVFGPYTLDRVYTCDEYNLMRAAAIAAADADVNFQNYTRIFIVFPNPGNCGWAGLGTLGCGSLSSADGGFTASTSWLLASYMGSRDNGVKLSTHEGGHNLTLHHASSRDFGAETLGPLAAAGVLNEYGDPQSTMGSWNFGQYGAPHKVRMGWLSGANVQTTETSGSYFVAPYELTMSGVQALKVRRGTANNAWMWIEYRQPIGLYDSTLASQVFTGGLIHYEDSATGTHTHLVDFTKGTSSYSDAALAGSWTDPYTNISLSMTSATSTGLSLNVHYGPVPCTRAQPTVSLSPPNPSAASGASVAYSVAVTNNDSTGCTASTFDLSSVLPSTWSSTFSTTSVLLNPAQSGSATMTVSVPAGWTPGTFPVSATAADAAHSATANANCTVTAPPQPIVVTSLTASPSNVALRKNVSLQTTITRAGGPVAGATVTFKVARPNGTVTKTVTTNAAGVASWNYKTQARGAHAVTVTATSSGASAAGGPVGFTVY